LTLARRVPRPLRDQRARKRTLVHRRSAPERQLARVVVDADERTGVAAGDRVDDGVAGVEAVLLRWKAEPVELRLAVLIGPADAFEPTDRLRVLDQLRNRHLQPLEVGPPDRFCLAPV